MNLKDLMDDIHKTAVEHGWWESKQTLPELLALIHSEVSEALEEVRNHHKPNETYYSGHFPTRDCKAGKGTIYLTSPTPNFICQKPEGIPAELADIIIRVLDVCAGYDIDIIKAIEEKIAFNKTREHKHGGKLL